MTARRALISELEERRWSVLEIIISAGLIALGINLVSDPLSAALGTVGKLILACVFIGLGVAFLAFRHLRQPEHRIRVNGMALVESSGITLIDVPGYRLAHELSRTQEAVFAEQAALRKQWEAKPLFEAHEVKREGGRMTWSFDRRAGSVRLLHEIMEYVLLERLSTHLTDYFAKADLDSRRVRHYERADLPELLLSNRVLELLSRPMTDREGFHTPEEGEAFRVAWQSGEGGRVFSRLDLSLPKDVGLSRLADGSIQLQSPYISLRLAVSWEGFSGNTPLYFEKLYVRPPGSEELRPILLWFDFVARIRLRGVLSGAGWEYYRWVESFLDYIVEQFDWEVFLDRIRWPQIEATVRALDRMPSPGPSSVE